MKLLPAPAARHARRVQFAMFKDREDAGRKLAKALGKYRGRDVLVLGIPRGGAITAYYVAEDLKAQLGIIVSRKLPYPYNPEAGFGAVAEDGSVFMFPYARKELNAATIDAIIAQQKIEAKKRVNTLRGGQPLPDMKGKTVIVVDDGIAMGSTMMAAIRLCKAKGAAKVIAAAPVAGPDSAELVRGEADELVVLETPPFFQAVAQVYEDWHDVGYDEVIGLMKKRNAGKRVLAP